ncbi:MAG: acyl-ACP--UDP-N-acetylglucosamine O-acyltransferase [Bacteroidetes bacterium]|nr:acyl-ACP--UDP-N-acetylglucosamine O-acyltransferase [Bacteroidota bacterium]MCK4288561.1 acyl-ACP--UDP-N-acetylglucosamine O-acyltransferase [Bacteroidales bacterium]MCK4360196.1 acyl-ACP--UDP-N-acetylglucosamine O-acyltransferase [Bacteroidales bacterium]MCK4406626.1 acyl-ACP--UDP-N-acetylglucosamine O-acyltransferase [Bacteroidales bacterium]
MNQPLAYVNPQAKVANNVVIEPFVNIEKNVVIEENTWIGSNVTIMEGARIGKNCRIFPGAVISAIPQDLKFAGEETLVKIGDNTTIREFVTINRGTKANYETIVGKNCLLMAYVHIAHDCIIGDNVILANAATLAGHIKINDWAIIGGLAAIHQFVIIGAHSMVSGGGMARKDVPPFTKGAREPLSYVGVNSIGLRRRGFTNRQINAIQDIYRIIYLKGYNVSQAVSIIEADVPITPERDEILSFISNSTRGIMKGYTGLQKNNNE